MSRWPATSVLGACVLSTAIAVADTIPTQGVTDARVRTAPYRSDDVYRLTGRVGYQIDIEFAADERYTGLASGDAEGLSFEAQDNHLFIKPKAAHVATNLTILTDHRHYFIDYSVVPKPRPSADVTATDDSLIYALRFQYPADPSTADAARVSSALSSGRVERNGDYAYCGSPAIRPIEASDNGIQTHLTFAARSELPAVFVRNEDGSESLTNLTVEGDSLIIHRIARRLMLRRGKLVGCVVNQHFDGSGARPESGTLSPDVERVAPKVDP